MNRNPRWFSLFCLAVLFLASAGQPSGGVAAAEIIQKPVLLWSGGGCSNGYCQTGWYSSPAVANLDGDPQLEVIGAAYSVYILDGLTGAVQVKTTSGHDVTQTGTSDVGRTWPDIALADINHDGSPEIITAHNSGWVSAYTKNLTFLSGWPKQATPDYELRSLGVSDLDHDNAMEILVASTRPSNQWTVYEPNGSVRASWPQIPPNSDPNSHTWGCFNQNLAAGDMDGDGKEEVIAPNDTHTLAAFQDDGTQIRANLIFGTIGGMAKFWSQVGVHVDQNVDIRGYANCGVEHRPNFANSAPIIVDVNGDGKMETVVIGNVYNCATNPYTDLYEIPYILNGDRTRWAAGGYDWTVLPTPKPGSAPLSEDWHVIENSHPNPTAADLDNDGKMEIIYPSYDGRVHVYWLDKTEHGSWPYTVKKPGDSVLRFASEAAVADLNGDGQAEVIFTSWPQIGSNQTGKLHILSSTGVPLQEISLPAAMGGANWNGGLAAPTLADIDNDPSDLEVIINTAHSGLVAYHLPGTGNARVLWGTGRGSYQRSGALLKGYAAGSTLRANQLTPSSGATITFTIKLRSLGTEVPIASLSNPIPSGLSFKGSLFASSGASQYSNGAVTWTGSLVTGQPVTITYQVTVDSGITQPTLITSTAQLNDGNGAPLQIHGNIFVNGKSVFLPNLARWP